jgi:hypothetical protein
MALALTPGRTAAVGLLCALAATVGVWSGPLAAATGALHTSGAAIAHAALHAPVRAGHTAS